MIITDPLQLDFSNYKRFFAFGCSFTQYRWPTWCDIIAHDNPHMEYHNLGKSGAGNLYIFNQINQHMNKYNLGKGDLVMVLWSSFYREDRYIMKHAWVTPGNIYSQADYPEEFVDNWCCPRGMTIRDLGLIDAANRLFAHCDFDVTHTLAIPYDMQTHYSGKSDSIIEEFNLGEVYDLWAHLPQGMHQTLLNCFPDGWKMEYTNIDEQGNQYTDYHPTVMGYLHYLKALGINISKATQTWAFGEHQRMLATPDAGEIGNAEPVQILE